MRPIPPQAQIGKLRRRREQLETHLQRCVVTANESNDPNPSLGRELDDTSAVLARLRAELEQLERQLTATGPY